MKKTVYIETSIVSYLTARPSSNLLAAAWQKITIDWWDTQQNRFCLYTSDIVIEEAGKGNPKASELRISILSEIPILEITDSVLAFSKLIIKKGVLPQKAIDDSLHIALSVIHGIDYLLTWNCRHIANAEIKPIIRKLCEDIGYSYPEICTPIELMGVYQNG
ncbi:MAG: type II toxin-antitoxin system VapC family toxin [Desulfobacterales bacterium]|nr:type II toxin-antitoxin system VapC family toxin [Desulfobacterales bacterium]